MRRSPEGIANAVRMKRRQRNLCFVLIEGRTDSLIFDRVINRRQCQLEPAQSKANVLRAVAILEADNFPGVLGIVDADRSRIAGDLPGSDNVLLTDGCDLESMLLRSPALDKLLSELGSTEKIERFEVTGEILERSLRLAYEMEYFRASELYAAIQGWERRNSAYGVLA